MKLFVIGKPLEHSMSPIIQNYWLKKYSKRYSYAKKEVNKDYLPKIIDQIEERKIIGVNVTIPYKKDIFNLLVNLDKNAFYSKAVNTIYKKNDSVFGENTDGAGFCKALEKEKNNNTVKGDLIKSAFITSTMGVSYKLKLGKLV